MNTYIEQHKRTLAQLAEFLLYELRNCGEFTYTTGIGIDGEVARRKYAVTFYDLVSKPNTALLESLERYVFRTDGAFILDAIRTEIEYEVEDLSLEELRANIKVKELEVA